MLEDNNDGGEGMEVKRHSRPDTARKRPPKVVDGAKELTGKDIAPVAKKAEGILKDGEVDEVRHTLYRFIFIQI